LTNQEDDTILQIRALKAKKNGKSRIGRLFLGPMKHVNHMKKASVAREL